MNTKCRKLSQHRYILEPYKGMNTRYHCPNCQKRDKTFSRYIDTQTGEHLHPNVGRCSRESKCGYHYAPKQYFQDNNIPSAKSRSKPYVRVKVIISTQKPVSFISTEIFKASLTNLENNHFVSFLIHRFGVEITNEVVSKYFIGTSKHWDGATVFWQIDALGKVRTGKIMLYNPTTARRVKEPFNHINWVHKVLEQSQFELRQCLFGEHLLLDKTKPVAIVESEKTAVIASIYLPQFIWLAVGSLTNLNVEKCSVLKGRTAILFPDLRGYEKWKKKAKELSLIARFSISDLLERKATEIEKEEGLDLADYLVKRDHKDFFVLPSDPLVQQKHIVTQPVGKINPINRVQTISRISTSEIPRTASWEQEIADLEYFFTHVKLPTQPLQLDPGSTIKNISLFIESHLAASKSNNGGKAYRIYLERLRLLREILNNNFGNSAILD